MSLLTEYQAAKHSFQGPVALLLTGRTFSFGHFSKPWFHYTEDLCLLPALQPIIEMPYWNLRTMKLSLIVRYFSHDFALEPKSKMDRLLELAGFSVWGLFKKLSHFILSVKPLLFGLCHSTIFIFNSKCLQIWH